MEKLNQESDPVTPIPQEEFYYIFPAGLLPGMLISAETIRRAQEAEERIKEKKDKKKTPKPPRRPNARTELGNIALGNT
ncbi:hypothetical protein KW794_01870 [Candidatus Saccharibacteria bacterium]|nr:hypothetical protein [Candidatus Saccharibacteria bacterium]